MSAIAPQITGHVDGFAIRFDAEVVDVFPTWEGAVAGLRAARTAITQLAPTTRCSELDRVLSDLPTDDLEAVLWAANQPAI